MVEYIELKSQKEILEALYRYNTSATRTISERVLDIEAYSKKLYKLAENYMIYIGKKGVGFFSYYDNDTIEQKAYLILIAIEAEYQRMKLGSQAIHFVCEKCREKKMKVIRLEVDKDNSAYYFYEKKGFQIVGEASPYSFYMEKEV